MYAVAGVCGPTSVAWSDIQGQLKAPPPYSIFGTWMGTLGGLEVQLEAPGVYVDALAYHPRVPRTANFGGTYAHLVRPWKQFLGLGALHGIIEAILSSSG